MIQIFTGIFLILFYVPSERDAFIISDYVTRENLRGFIFRIFHLNGASFIFVVIYSHIIRGIYFFSFRLINVWIVGTTIVLLTMISAFLGYVLPYGQISFWGATVITNLLRTVPYIGQELVIWVWGGFRINKCSLSLFFLLHFLVPFIILGLVIIHLIFLHETRRTRKILIQERYTKVKFYPYFVYKDIFNFIIVFLFYSLSLFFPWNLGDPENWIKANPIISPVHIQPEWYFLYAYAILRCIPRKVGGVIALCLRVCILYFLSLNFRYTTKIKFVSKIFYIFIFLSFFILTWLGGCPVEDPYILMRQVFTIIFFFCFIFYFF